VSKKAQLREKIRELEVCIEAMRAAARAGAAMAAFRMTKMTASEMGRRGGKKRAANMSAAQRRAAALKAINARWDRTRAAMVNPPLPKRRKRKKVVAVKKTAAKKTARKAA
jgi:hypothetical protein